MEAVEASKDELLICSCENPEHQIVFRYFESDIDEQDKEVYMMIHLSKLKFVQRIVYGLKYIFGYQSNTGAFEEIVLKIEDAYKLKSIYQFLSK